MKKWMRSMALLLVLVLTLSLAGCGMGPDGPQGGYEGPQTGQNGDQGEEIPQKGNYYYDLENVVLYLDFYGELPPNYITKSEARKLGWEGDSVEPFKEGAAIGGDTFGNREGLLPKAKGRTYTECDLSTLGKEKRGAERLVFSNDGLYFHTRDHYESFTQGYVEEGKVVK